MVSATDISLDEVKRHVVECFSDLASTVGSGFQPETHYADLERLEQECLGQEHINALEEQIERRDFCIRIEASARASMEEREKSFDDLSQSSRLRLMEGIARAHIEAHRFYMFRIRERLMRYQVQDPILRKPWPWVPSIAATTQAATPTQPGAALAGHTVQELVDEYVEEKRPSWVPKTYSGVRRHLSYLVEVVGPNTPVAALTKQHIRDLRDGAVRLRLNHHVGPSKSFGGRQTNVLGQRVASKTAAAILADANTFLKWTVSNGFREHNPADGITVTAPKTKKGEKPRLPFAADDLKKLFSAPLFTGCASRARRHDPGPEIISDAHYWLPVLGFYTGARLGELVQLRFENVILDGPIPYFDMNESGGGDFGSGDHKHLKTKAAVRKVPIHPDLIRLGFDKFVVRVTKARKGLGRLFYEVRYGADDVASSVFSKWFGRFMGRAGLGDPRLVFHSFRHAMEDALRNAGQPQYVIDRIIGHTGGEQGDGYGEGTDLEIGYEALKKAKLLIDLPDHLKHYQPKNL